MTEGLGSNSSFPFVLASHLSTGYFSITIICPQCNICCWWASASHSPEKQLDLYLVDISKRSLTGLTRQLAAPSRFSSFSQSQRVSKSTTENSSCGCVSCLPRQLFPTTQEVSVLRCVFQSNLLVSLMLQGLHRWRFSRKCWITTSLRWRKDS